MPTKILTFSTLFPNVARPHHGIFTETTLRQQLATGEIEAKVVAPIPWFPLSHAVFGEYSIYAKVPVKSTRIGVEVFHPRYLALPKTNMYIAPFSLAQAARPVIARLIDEGYDFDVIDAHYFYPDGVAAALLGKYFDKPVVISALGTDINVIMNNRIARQMMLWASASAASVITVCEALKTKMVGLGMNGAAITPLRNGVDLELFQPVDRDAYHSALGMDGFTLLSVGHLHAGKGHHHVIIALAHMAGVSLMIAGSGVDRRKLEVLARNLGVADRVTFLGAMPQQQLRHYYGAADALVLASSREGWANVLLESMACGTPVIASAVGGTPEVIGSPAAGVLVPDGTPDSIVDGVRRLRAAYPDHAATRAYAEQFGWGETTRGQIHLLRKATRESPPNGVLTGSA